MQNLTRGQKDYLIELFDNLRDYMYIDIYDSEEDNAKPIYRAINLQAVKQIINEPEYYDKRIKREYDKK